jgi:adenylate kinase
MSQVGVIVLLGPPGSGKGTQASRLQEKNPAWIHVSTGNLFRKEIASGSPLGNSVKDIIAQGKLVSDEVTNQVFASQVAQILKNQKPQALILDGYPRTGAQGQFLASFAKEQGLKAPVPLELRVPEDQVVFRLADRLVNAKTGRIYHRVLNPPKVVGICDEDGSALIQRSDDNPETIRSRYALYRSERDGIVSSLGGESSLLRVDGIGSPEEVGNRLLGAIEALRKS